MRKLSKSDNPGAPVISANMPKSEHFAVGTLIKIAHKPPAEILSRPGNGFMLIRHADGTTEILRPYCLQWEWEN